jgi:predicted Zn-dependent protease with MMP-like domain
VTEGDEPFDDEEFAELVQSAVASLPADLASALSNVEILVADRDPGHPGRLGLYQGVPLTRRTSGYVFALPDRITIYRGELERIYGRDRARLEERVRHVVLHEIAHHFGISDERLREIDRY